MNRNQIIKNNLKLLTEGNRKTLLENKLIINEEPAAGSKWFRALRSLLGRQFGNKWTDVNSFLTNVRRRQILAQGNNWRKDLIRIQKSGANSGFSSVGKTGKAARVLRDLNTDSQIGEIIELIINDEGAYIVRTADGQYYYMSPDGGFLKLPSGFDVNRDDIPSQLGHVSWFDPNYKMPLLGGGALSLDYLLSDEDNLIDQDDSWHPPMSPPDMPPDYVSAPSEYEFDPEDQYVD